MDIHPFRDGTKRAGNGCVFTFLGMRVALEIRNSNMLSHEALPAAIIHLGTREHSQL